MMLAFFKKATSSTPPPLPGFVGINILVKVKNVKAETSIQSEAIMLFFNAITLNDSTAIFICYIILSISSNQQYFLFDTVRLYSAVFVYRKMLETCTLEIIGVIKFSFRR